MSTVNEDSFASDEVLSSQKENANEELNCPLCLNIFRSPRQLPCSHSFCEGCLQSHISKNRWKLIFKENITCPVCKSEIHLQGENSDERLASLFPVSTFVLYMLFKVKRDGDRTCDACHLENLSSPAEWYCFDCNEAMCTDCSKFHRKQKLLKDHNAISIDEFITKPESVTQFGAEFRCDMHVKGTRHGKEKRCLVCVDHGDNYCFNNKNDDMTQIKEALKICEDDVTKLLASNLTNSSNLPSQAKRIMDQVRDLRKKLNDAFDQLEIDLQQRIQFICWRELSKIQETDKRCQSLKAAIKNTYVVSEAVDKYGSHEQKDALAKKIKHHTSGLKRTICQRTIKTKALTFHLDINPILNLILAIPTRNIFGLKVRRNECEVYDSDKEWLRKSYKPRMVDSLTTEVSNNAVYISQSSIIFANRNRWLNLDLSTKRTTVGFMPEGCNDASSVCIIGDKKVAVSFPTLKTVYLFSVYDGNLRVKDHFNTRQMCSSIIAVNRNDIIVSGQCDDGQSFYWSLVTLQGKETSYHEFDGHGESHTHVALTSRKTLLYLCIRGGNSLYCFGLDGALYYRKRLEGLVGAAGVALDKDDNVYVVGEISGNIIQVSQDGKILNVFQEGITRSPCGIFFNPSGDQFICFSNCELIDKSRVEFMFDRIKEMYGLKERTKSAYLYQIELKW
ncbi:hypothetical protein ACJMK2_000680 [Sinanodonta woodiana]|uniref:Uncharacterized protein n=1 Tax=Sinanodonta woodiana TaxID=1069815 RepID=A0ABD3XQ02_SINWO